VRCCLASQLVGDHPPRLASLTLQQVTEDAFSRTPIATRLDKDVNYIAVLIDSTPEIVSVLLTLDGYEELIQVPRIAQATLSPLEPTRIFGT
jgi:hypothetical protein